MVDGDRFSGINLALNWIEKLFFQVGAGACRGADGDVPLHHR
jgi:hypothetical protein